MGAYKNVLQPSVMMLHVRTVAQQASRRLRSSLCDHCLPTGAASYRRKANQTSGNRALHTPERARNTPPLPHQT